MNTAQAFLADIEQSIKSAEKMANSTRNVMLSTCRETRKIDPTVSIAARRHSYVSMYVRPCNSSPVRLMKSPSPRTEIDLSPRR